MSDAAAELDPPTQTAVLPPRQRVFLPASPMERAADVLWGVARVLLFRFSPPPLHGWRAFLLRAFGARIARGATIEPSVLVRHPWRLAVGERSSIAHRAILDCMGEIAIGADVRISQYAHLCAGTHEYTRPDMRIVRRPIVVEDGVWIAADAFIGPGVRIGRRAIVAARSSVFHDLPPEMIAAGEPASVRRPRPADRS